ncbi:hypothetical protein N7E02_20815 [Aliirhizobium terrae]|uniref:hypothetical protein n=1 Tax=Terrirhizobium terrae TaxID=2926709 RepID=UPI00257809BD|nr:hypothetical protein [Rhizobium sp. CC-CFT758]WJH39281.1 hypothetical protein N7E02_20815 [Rhizobium sp. CC-CFT758]
MQSGGRPLDPKRVIFSAFYLPALGRLVFKQDPMNFAKFFHKAPGDDDRMLFLAVDGDVLIGSYLREVDYLGFDWATYDKTKDNLPGEFLRIEIDDENEGITAFRREAEALRRQGYIETHHTRHTLRDLNGDFTPKPEWQQTIDEALMSAFADPLDVQAERNAAFIGTPAQEQPLAKWLEARYASAMERPDSLELAEQACAAWRRCQAEGHAGYIWSVYSSNIEGELFELLGREYLFEGPNCNPAAALVAITVARKLRRHVIVNGSKPGSSAITSPSVKWMLMTRYIALRVTAISRR